MTDSLPIPHHPEQIRSALNRILGSVFVDLLAEMAFADAWMIPSLDESNQARSLCDRWCLLSVTGDWSGRILLGSDVDLLTGLSAGYHSLPDDLVDENLSLEFLAELGAALVRELVLQSPIPLKAKPMGPRIPTATEVDSLWGHFQAGRSVFGCNSEGNIAVLVMVDD